MSWEDRIRQAAYTSPSGERIEFDFRDVSRETSKRTTAFEFLGVDGAYVQDNGFGARRYPLQCYFSGADCDIAAARFEAALLERGAGRLEHPFYGTFDVVPYGDISRRDDLASAANQAIVEVTFWTTLRALYPSDQAAAPNEIIAAADATNIAASEQYAASVDVSTVGFQEGAKTSIGGVLDAINGTIASVASGSASTKARFTSMRNAIVTGLDDIITRPAIVAFEMAELIQIPARDAQQFASMRDAYQDLLDEVLALPDALPELRAVPEMSDAETSRENGFRTVDATVAGIVSALSIAAMTSTHRTRSAAVAAADDLVTMFDEAIAWRDAGFGTIGRVDTGEAYQALVDQVSKTAAYLVQLSFDLPAEKRVTLTRPRSLIELCAELYGAVDEKLDDLINANNLLPSEILEVPRGREIVFYV